MGVNIKKLNAPLLYNYQYDQLNRLTNMDAWNRTSTAWSALTSTTDFHENVSYDPNGNILTYHRNRETVSGSNQMDQLQYNYIPGTNQLDHIYDSVSFGSNANDITSQSSGNYKYDSIGELIGDAASNISNITWTVYGKIASIEKTTDTVIRYAYDPAGNRISKTVSHGGDSTTTWYVRDAQGNILSVYTSGDAAVNGGGLAQTELDVYGSNRLGVWNRTTNVVNLDSTVHSSFPKSGDSLIFTRGSKLFELTNHLGNVLATISDKRYGVTADDSTVVYYNPAVVSANDYYPFGMMQYARSWPDPSDRGYRYGFNGKENDNEVKGAGNQIDYGMRVFDPRVGRFLSVDPLAKRYPWYSPFQYAGDKPVWKRDVDGLEEEDLDEVREERDELENEAEKEANQAKNRKSLSSSPRPQNPPRISWDELMKRVNEAKEGVRAGVSRYSRNAFESAENIFKPGKTKEDADEEEESPGWKAHEDQVFRDIVKNNPGGQYARQVTLDITNKSGQTVTIVEDVVSKGPGSHLYQLVNAKYSEVKDLAAPNANLQSTLTTNQKVGYPWIATGDIQSIVARGPNARELGIPEGSVIQVDPVIKIAVVIPQTPANLAMYGNQGILYKPYSPPPASPPLTKK
jgi:RHS repeat-associated protein